jgi:hypothetical protein
MDLLPFKNFGNIDFEKIELNKEYAVPICQQYYLISMGLTDFMLDLKPKTVKEIIHYLDRDGKLIVKFL